MAKDQNIPEQNHRCKFESDIAVMQSNINDIKEQTSEVLRIIKGGNGRKGLSTDVELNKQSITRIWWWIGLGTGLSSTLFGVVIYIMA